MSIYAKSRAFWPLSFLSKKEKYVACLYSGANILHDSLNTLA